MARLYHNSKGRGVFPEMTIKVFCFLYQLQLLSLNVRCFRVYLFHHEIFQHYPLLYKQSFVQYQQKFLPKDFRQNSHVFFHHIENIFFLFFLKNISIQFYQFLNHKLLKMVQMLLLLTFHQLLLGLCGI